MSPKAGDVKKEDTVAAIPKRLILMCVLLALLLSCAATVGGVEALLPVLEIPGVGVVQVSSEGLLEERLTLPRSVHARFSPDGDQLHPHQPRRAGNRGVHIRVSAACRDLI